MSITNVVSMSGGKDSTAQALLGIEQGADNLRFVFADTGHEHTQTYEYIDYLESRLGIKIECVKADFSRLMAGKREFIKTKWAEHGVPQSQIDAALEVLKPTGIPFLDLCLWKGRFPSTRRRFCSEQLKHIPLNNYMEELLTEHKAVISWQGVRRDESASRANLPERDVEIGQWEPEPSGLLIYRPILDWTAADTFAIAKRHGLEPNPLYKQGMGRVGCMPCIHATKRETFEIARRFPEEMERLAEWERLVGMAAKRGVSTFFDARIVQRHLGLPPITPENVGQVTAETHGVKQYIEWSKTSRGGRQYDLIKALEIDEELPMCQSQYGLCE